MKDFFHYIVDKRFIALLGQTLIITGLVATACLAVRELRKKPRTFWFIFLNRIRYIFYIGFWRFITTKKSKLPDHPYNYSYLWLCENKIYIAYQFYLFTTLDLVYQMITQISTGFIFSKSKDFFISSPIRSFCTFYIVAFLINEATRWKRKYLEQMKEAGKIIDTSNKISELS